MNEAITIRQLHASLTECMKMGLGHKKILISTDDEGNGYHELFYGVTFTPKVLDEIFSGKYAPDTHGVPINEVITDYVILG